MKYGAKYKGEEVTKNEKVMAEQVVKSLKILKEAQDRSGLRVLVEWHEVAWVCSELWGREAVGLGKTEDDE